MQKFIIGENDANQRLDKFLTKMFPCLPQSMMYKSIRKKDIKLNGKRCEISSRLSVGDTLELYIKDEFLETKQSKPDVYSVVPVLSILYEDENIILVDKKPGISVHSDLTQDKSDDLVTQIQAYLYLKGEYNPDDKSSFTPSLCNRIDKNTGGIVIAAKNATALRTINEKIKNREILKKYLCIIHGTLDKKSDTLNAYHIKNSKLNRAFIFDTPQEGARKISTKYKVLKEKDGLSLVEVDLLTGRTHQIRAHFAYIGHPLAGDTKYGTNKQNQHLGFKHQALYSYKIKFNFSSPSPLDYLKGKEFTVEKVDFAQNF
ncbi:MAG: RluA family pseudouridine synthase [Clostridia bacterium]|nr:RluA family pseudouridine synthase [Clostridia bacterium]